MRTTKTQKLTILLFLLYFIWEFIVYQWSKTQVDAVIRADLLLIYPILLVLLLISIYQKIKSK